MNLRRRSTRSRNRFRSWSRSRRSPNPSRSRRVRRRWSVLRSVRARRRSSPHSTRSRHRRSPTTPSHSSPTPHWIPSRRGPSRNRCRSRTRSYYRGRIRPRSRSDRRRPSLSFHRASRTIHPALRGRRRARPRRGRRDPGGRRPARVRRHGHRPALPLPTHGRADPPRLPPLLPDSSRCSLRRWERPVGSGWSGTPARERPRRRCCADCP